LIFLFGSCLLLFDMLSLLLFLATSFPSDFYSSSFPGSQKEQYIIEGRCAFRFTQRASASFSTIKNEGLRVGVRF